MTATESPSTGSRRSASPGVMSSRSSPRGSPRGPRSRSGPMRFWTVVVGAPPNPRPSRPAAARPCRRQPGTDLSAYVRDVVARTVPAADRKAGALSIAAVYREAVRLGRDGKFATPQAMVTFVAESMRTARPASSVRVRPGAEVQGIGGGRETGDDGGLEPGLRGDRPDPGGDRRWPLARGPWTASIPPDGWLGPRKSTASSAGCIIPSSAWLHPRSGIAGKGKVVLLHKALVRHGGTGNHTSKR